MSTGPSGKESGRIGEEPVTQINERAVRLHGRVVLDPITTDSIMALARALALRDG